MSAGVITLQGHYPGIIASRKYNSPCQLGLIEAEVADQSDPLEEVVGQAGQRPPVGYALKLK